MFVQQREQALQQMEQYFPSRAEEGIHEARVKAEQTGTVGFEIVEQDVSDPAVIRCLTVMADASRAALIEVTLPREALPRLKQEETGPTIYITGYLSALAASVSRWRFDPYEVLCQEHPFHVALPDL